MKELEWIKELNEDFKSGDKDKFPARAHPARWENIDYIDEDSWKLAKGIARLSLLSAEKGDYAEMHHLGEYYLMGRHHFKLPADYGKAIYWYSRAAEYKSLYCGETLYRLAWCYKHSRGANLGWCLENGYGVEKDIKRAVKYYKEAAENGNIVAKNNLNRLRKAGIIGEETVNVGIFWAIPDNAEGQRVLEFHESLRPDAADSSGFINYPYSHYEVWEREVKGLGDDCYYYPRGRVIYDAKHRLYKIFADECVGRAAINKITDLLGIDSWALCRDEHYVCRGCEKKVKYDGNKT